MSPDKSQKLSSIQLTQQRQYSIYSLVLFLFILILATSLIIVSDYRRFEKQFTVDVEKLHNRFNFYIKQNEAVLEGLSAFVAGVGGVNDEMLNRYAKQVKARFPHIYMLEVAEEVKKSNLKSFIQKRIDKGHAGFDVWAFDYSRNRKWRKLPEKDNYFPLIYLYPLTEKSHKVFGLDLSLHEHLAVPLKKALDVGGYQTSLPFNLIEGNKAFVMFKAVDLGEGDSVPCFMTLIVITADTFLFDYDVKDNSLGLLVYHNSKAKENKSGHFFLKEFEVNNLLPRFVFETSLEQNQTGLVLQITRQFQFRDISWVLLFIILNVFTTVFFITKGVSSKNKLMQNKLLQASQQKHKMVAVSNLTGGIAHEFNNNLSVIRGFLNLLSDKVDNDSESKSWINHAEKATEKSIKLTHKLLTYSRYKGIRERVSNIMINEHIIDLKKDLSRFLNENVNLEFDLAVGLSSVLFSEDDLKEILFELVENANDAIEGNGLITISTRKIYLTAPQDIEMEDDVDLIPGDYIHLAVSDTGSGISDDIKLHVFDPFFTTKTFGESSGMGLASVYGLVKLNNGYINLSSDGTNGSVFNIYIPFLE